MSFADNDLFRLGAMKKTSCPAIIAFISCVLISCVTANPSNETPFDLNDLKVDPLWCTGISLRNDVQITREIIHEPSIMSNRFLIVLRYREGGDEAELTPELKAGYNNISLVSEVKTGTDIPTSCVSTILCHRDVEILSGAESKMLLSLDNRRRRYGYESDAGDLWRRVSW